MSIYFSNGEIIESTACSSTVTNFDDHATSSFDPRISYCRMYAESAPATKQAKKKFDAKIVSSIYVPCVLGFRIGGA
jgi:hypothetical protein